MASIGLMPAGTLVAGLFEWNENGDWIRYRSDGRGFNNPDTVWRSRRVDIAALGDSFTHGFCVPGNENFVDLIRQREDATALR